MRAARLDWLSGATKSQDDASSSQDAVLPPAFPFCPQDLLESALPLLTNARWTLQLTDSQASTGQSSERLLQGEWPQHAQFVHRKVRLLKGIGYSAVPVLLDASALGNPSPEEGSV